MENFTTKEILNPVKTYITIDILGTKYAVPFSLLIESISTQIINLIVSGDATIAGNITAANLSGTNTGDVTVTDSSTIDFVIAGQSLTAAVIDNSITNAKVANGIAATKIGAGNVDNTEFDYLNGVTSKY